MQLIRQLLLVLVVAAGALVWLASAGAAADPAVITDSGSTNTAGFRIEVKRSGEGVYIAKPRRAGQLSEAQMKPRNRKIPSAVVERFFADLEASKLSALPSQGCMKSASFGTTLTVEYHDQTSPDLRCGDHGNAKLRALIADTEEVIKVFGSS